MRWTTKTRKEILAAISRGHTPEMAAALLNVPQESLKVRLQDPDFQAEIRMAKLHHQTKIAACRIDDLATQFPKIRKSLGSFAQRLRCHGALSLDRHEDRLLDYLKGASSSLKELLGEPEFELFSPEDLEEIIRGLVAKGRVEVRHVEKFARGGQKVRVPVYFFRE